MKLRTRLRLNTVFGLLNQIIVLVCGLIVPRLILIAYGTEVNGLVNSITSFLNVISFLELGVGAVVQASLYKPLAENDIVMVSKIYKYANRFFKIIGIIFVIYTIVVSIVYSCISSLNFDFMFTFMLFMAIALSMFAQYFFGIVNQLLLFADQKNYISYIVQSLTVIINLVGTIVLIRLKCNIQVVKLFTSLVYLIRPILLFVYVKKKYKLIKTEVCKDVLPEKWNGLAQHIASFVLDNTDIIVLTIFATLADVSIYSIYYLVAKSIAQLVFSLSSGITSYYGNAYAVKDYNRLTRDFEWFTSIIVSFSAIVSGIAIIMIVPFVSLYTEGVTDANYIQYEFGLLMMAAIFVKAFRYSYNSLILAMGKFKDTQLSAIIEAILNIVISIVFVVSFGLVGVAIGTIVALTYRTIYFAIYLKKSEVGISITVFIKQLLFSIIILTASSIIMYFYKFTSSNYLEWIKQALIYSLVIFGIGLPFFIVLNIKTLIKRYIHKK